MHLDLILLVMFIRLVFLTCALCASFHLLLAAAIVEWATFAAAPTADPRANQDDLDDDKDDYRYHYYSDFGFIFLLRLALAGAAQIVSLECDRIIFATTFHVRMVPITSVS